MDISAWWVLAAFFVGGYIGALLVALMTVAASDGGAPADSVEGPGAVATGSSAARWGI